MLKPDLFTQINAMIVHVTDIEYIRCSADWSLPPQIASSNKILFICKGTGIFQMIEQSCRIGAGNLLFIPRGQKVEAFTEHSEPLVMYEISFTYEALIKKNARSSVYREEGSTFPLEGEVHLSNHLQALHLCEQLHISMQELEGGRRQYRQTGLLNELLYLACSDIQDGMNQQRAGVERTVDYLHQNYMKTVPLEMLSSLAGFSPSYYSRLFKKLKGVSPITYITRLRMNRAKELLVHGQESLFEIAQHLGYNEESYFSRMFKRETGYSPAQYVKVNRKHVVTMRHSFNGDFLALGVQPHASVGIRSGEGDNAYFNAQLKGTVPIRMDGEVCMDDLLRLQPTIIVCDPEWIKWNQELSHIAPTVIIPYWEMAWRDRLHRIAELVGRRKEAKEWLHKYEQKVEQASVVIKQQIGEGTVIILRIVGGKLRVYGMERNIGCVLYQDLKLNPPPKVKSVKWRRTITLNELPTYDADYMLLMASADKVDQKMLRRLLQSSEWKSLSAVRRHQWFTIDLYPWIDYSALSHDRVIDEAMNLFASVR
ncbi:helix-turn-helix domain-containing protein [Paenibacillus alba]|uniref:helix-turn-helix domain-containing protein n=1 Tax=Paenibacillus alba TaxID=1197127 RepID=UPI001565DB57|nr:helix-turn-helix domain-containing protein [Paenibacillus alba]NQX69486.1 helix-turn-helix domain-containing protein [Paenibacillus alba]